MGDQPEAIAQLVGSIRHGSKHNTLLGVTGSGKTFTVAKRHRAAEPPDARPEPQQDARGAALRRVPQFLPGERRGVFRLLLRLLPAGGYLPSTDTFIEKDLSINAEIEKMRLRTVATLLSGRRDVVVVFERIVPLRRRQPGRISMPRPSTSGSGRSSATSISSTSWSKRSTRAPNATWNRRRSASTATRWTSWRLGEFGSQCFRVMFYDNEVEAIQTIDPATGSVSTRSTT